MLTPPRPWLSILCAAVLFAGCAGAGGQSFSSVVPATNGAVGGGLTPAMPGATLVRVHVPWTAPGSGRPSPSPAPGGFVPFASPTPFGLATASAGSPLVGSAYPIQAMTINVSGPTPLNQTIALAPGSAGCGGTSTGTVCQAALSLTPGTYTAAISTYSSSNANPGNQIGNAQTIAFTVIAGGSNAINLTLSGAPASLDVVPGSSLSGENAQGAIDLYGAGKHQLLVELLDANQNIIVGAAPANYTIVQTGGPLSLTVGQPVPGAPNTFTVTTPPNNSGGQATLRVATMGGQATNVTLDVRQLLAVANTGNNTVTLYAAAQTGPIVTIQQGITDPQALVFDAQGDLFVANQPGSITEYAPPYASPPSTIAVGVNHPQALAVDARGDLFVANGSGTNTVTEYVSPYTGAPSATISNGIEDPVSLALDANSTLYVVNQSKNTVTAYAAPYVDAPTTISNGLNGPNSLTLDARGNLFVSNLNSTPNAVLQYAPPFSSSSVPTAWVTNGVNEAGAIGTGLTSNLFVPNQGSNTVTEYGAPYTGSPTTIAGGQNQPIALAVDALGNLFVANYGNSTVTQYPQPYGGPNWTTIATGVSNPQALALSPATASF